MGFLTSAGHLVVGPQAQQFAAHGRQAGGEDQVFSLGQDAAVPVGVVLGQLA